MFRNGNSIIGLILSLVIAGLLVAFAFSASRAAPEITEILVEAHREAKGSEQFQMVMESRRTPPMTTDEQKNGRIILLLTLVMLVGIVFLGRNFLKELAKVMRAYAKGARQRQEINQPPQLRPLHPIEQLPLPKLEPRQLPAGHESENEIGWL